MAKNLQCLNSMLKEFENIPNPLRKEFKSEPNVI